MDICIGRAKGKGKGKGKGKEEGNEKQWKARKGKGEKKWRNGMPRNREGNWGK